MLWSKPNVFVPALIALLALVNPGSAHAEGPFASLTGRWTGQGRLGFAEGKTENIT